jgi:lipopolysaccharide transport system ATP-binding protein
MAQIDLKQVSVNLPIYGAHNMNLKGRIANILTHRESEVEVIKALTEVSISIRNGERVGIIGPNGSGKTTLLRVIAGILKPDSGEVDVKGSVVSMIDQSLGLDLQCTGIENIYRRGLFLNQSGRQMDSRINEIVEFSGLGERIHHPLYTYSSGMKARLAFSISTSIKPEILIIDEGIGAADEEFASRASIRLGSFLDQAGILILASHSKQLIESWCTRKIHLEYGQVLNN